MILRSGRLGNRGHYAIESVVLSGGCTSNTWQATRSFHDASARVRRRAQALGTRRAAGRGPLPLPRRDPHPNRTFEHRPARPRPRTARRLRRTTPPPPLPRPRALRAWLDTAQITTGPLFRRVTRTSAISSPLTPQTVALIIKKRARAAGLDPREFAGHSLRSGYATQAARDGHHPPRSPPPPATKINASSPATSAPAAEKTTSPTSSDGPAPVGWGDRGPERPGPSSVGRPAQFVTRGVTVSVPNPDTQGSAHVLSRAADARTRGRARADFWVWFT
jgi:hypothetical protein